MHYWSVVCCCNVICDGDIYLFTYYLNEVTQLNYRRLWIPMQFCCKLLIMAFMKVFMDRLFCSGFNVDDIRRDRLDGAKNDK